MGTTSRAVLRATRPGVVALGVGVVVVAAAPASGAVTIERPTISLGERTLVTMGVTECRPEHSFRLATISRWVVTSALDEPLRMESFNDGSSYGAVVVPVRRGEHPVSVRVDIAPREGVGGQPDSRTCEAGTLTVQ